MTNFSLSEWRNIAERGTSGDMVHNILYDWETDRNNLLTLLKQAAYYVDSLTCPSVKREEEKREHSELCHKISEATGMER